MHGSLPEMSIEESVYTAVILPFLNLETKWRRVSYCLLAFPNFVLPNPTLHSTFQIIASPAGRGFALRGHRLVSVCSIVRATVLLRRACLLFGGGAIHSSKFETHPAACLPKPTASLEGNGRAAVRLDRYAHTLA